MATITRSQFAQEIGRGIDLSKVEGLDAASMAKLKALDTNNDGKLTKGAITDAFKQIDDLDRNGSRSSFTDKGAAGRMYRALTKASIGSPAMPAAPATPATPTSPATPARPGADSAPVTPTAPVRGAGLSPTVGAKVAAAATDRATKDGEGYALANAPTSPMPGLTSNREPGVSRPSWLKDQWKCNQFVGDALTQAGVKMPTNKMADGTLHYMNAESLPKQKAFFDKITDPSQIRPGDIMVIDRAEAGDATAHTEVITAHGPEGTTMTGAHQDGAYASPPRNLFEGATYSPETKSWSTPNGELFILRPKQLRDAVVIPPPRA